MHVVLLPGLDGTGLLLKRFAELLSAVDVTIARYPEREYLSYGELADLVRGIVPLDSPYIVIAESFSGPVAALLSADPEGDLRTVVFVGSFVVRPFGNIGSWCSRLIPGALLGHRLPRWFIRWFLTGDEGILELQNAVGEVRNDVLKARIRDAMSIDVEAAFGRSRVRAVCLVPKGDRILSRMTVLAFLRARPDTQVITVAGPHCLLHCAPQLCVEAIRSLGLLSDANP